MSSGRGGAANTDPDPDHQPSGTSIDGYPQHAQGAWRPQERAVYPPPRRVTEQLTVIQGRKGKIMGARAVRAVARFGGQTRYLWNIFVALNNERMKAEGKFIFGTELSAMLPRLLKEDTKLSGLPHRPAQQQAYAFDRALKRYIADKDEFKRIDAKRKARSAARVAAGLPPLKPKKAGLPQFKRRDDHTDGFSFVAIDCRFEPGRVRLQKIGWVRVRGLNIPDGAALKQVNVTQEPTGWHLSVQFDAAPRAFLVPRLPVLGIDHGLTTLSAWATGEKIEPPRYARKAEKHIRRLNRQRDRRKKGSVNRKRTVVRLGKAHRLVRNQRQDFLHKLTGRMVDTFEGFAVEDLNLKGLMQTRLAKSFADASLGELLRMLRYKSEWACREWRVIGRYQRSTGVCPDTGCGWIGPKLRPGIGTWTCGGCGVKHDRDAAAARVILRDATVIRAAGVPPARRKAVHAFGRKRVAAGAIPDGAVLPVRQEPAVMPRKRGAAVRDGGRASARPTHGGSPSNGVPHERQARVHTGHATATDHLSCMKNDKHVNIDFQLSSPPASILRTRRLAAVVSHQPIEQAQEPAQAHFCVAWPTTDRVSRAPRHKRRVVEHDRHQHGALPWQEGG